MKIQALAQVPQSTSSNNIRDTGQSHFQYANLIKHPSYITFFINCLGSGQPGQQLHSVSTAAAHTSSMGDWAT